MVLAGLRRFCDSADDDINAHRRVQAVAEAERVQLRRCEARWDVGKAHEVSHGGTPSPENCEPTCQKERIFLEDDCDIEGAT